MALNKIFLTDGDAFAIQSYPSGAGSFSKLFHTSQTTGDTAMVGATLTYNASAHAGVYERVAVIDDNDAVFGGTSSPSQTLHADLYSKSQWYSGFSIAPAGTQVKALYSYTLSGSDGSTVSIYGIDAKGYNYATDVAVSAPLQTGVTYTVTALDNSATPNYSDLYSGPTTDHIVTGTAGDDVINATYGGDVHGDILDGSDAANGSNDDVIKAGDGNDTIHTSLGNDTIDGGAGNDTIQGTSQIDVKVQNVYGPMPTPPGAGTIDKFDSTTGTATGSDTFTSVHNFVAAEEAGVTDKITMISTASGRGVINISDEAVGVFTPVQDASVPFDQQVINTSLAPINFGAPGQPTLSDILARNVPGQFKITSGTESGSVDGITFSNFEVINVAAPGGDQVVSGTAGADQINLLYQGDPDGDRVDAKDNYPGNNDDVIAAGAGDDTIWVSRGNDIIGGDDGSDTYRMPTFHGSYRFDHGNSTAETGTWPYFMMSGAGDVDGDGHTDVLITTLPSRTGIVIEPEPGGSFIESFAANSAHLIFRKDFAKLDAGDGDVDGRIKLATLADFPGSDWHHENNDYYKFKFLASPDPVSSGGNGSILYRPAINSVGDTDGDGKSNFLIESFESSAVVPMSSGAFSNPSEDVGDHHTDRVYYLLGERDLSALDNADGTADKGITFLRSGFAPSLLSDGSYKIYASGRLLGIGDLDGDGKTDFVYAQKPASETLPDGTAGFTLKSNIILSEDLPNLEALAASSGAADNVINLDNLFNPAVVSDPSSVLSAGSYEFRSFVPTPTASNQTADVTGGISIKRLGDIDGDGQEDLLVTEKYQIATTTTPSTGSPTTTYQNVEKEYVVSGADLNGLDLANSTSTPAQADQKIDLDKITGVANHSVHSANSYQFTVSGSGTSIEKISYAGDTDGDGKGGVAISINSPTGSAHKVYFVDANDFSTLDAADGSADGIIDVSNVAGTNSSTVSPKSYQFIQPINGGSNSFGLATVDSVLAIENAGDVDGDGKADLIITAVDLETHVDPDYGTVTDDMVSYLVAGKDLASLDAADGTIDGKIHLQHVSGANHATDSSGSYQFVGGLNWTGGRLSLSVSGTAKDWDGDGKSDLIVTSINNGHYSASGDKTVLHNQTGYYIQSSDLAKLDAMDGTVDGKIQLSNVAGTQPGSTLSTSYKFIGSTGEQLGGSSVAAAGDVDGDGRADFIIKSREVGVGAKTYMVSGKDLATLDMADGAADGIISVSNISGSTHTTHAPGSYEFARDSADIDSFSVSTAGDVDGDGKIDLTISTNGFDVTKIDPVTGAPVLDPTTGLPVKLVDAGATYIASGKDLSALDAADGSPDGQIQISNVIGGGTGSYQFLGEEAGDNANQIAQAGDVDGDGKADVVITAAGATDSGTGAGSVYVISGKDLDTLDKADNNTATADGKVHLFKVTGTDHATVSSGSYEIVGEAGSTLQSAASAGDVDGDGKSDILINASDADVTITDPATGTTQTLTKAGVVYLVSGKDLAALDQADDPVNNTADGKIQASNIYGANHATQSSGSYKILGERAHDHIGQAKSIGDIDGDGKGDFVIATSRDNSATTETDSFTYFISGKDLATMDAADNTGGAVDGQVQLSKVSGVTEHSTVSSGSYKFIAPDNVHTRIDSAGDVDGDGKIDLIIGAQNTPNGTVANVGTSYLVAQKDLAALDAADGSVDGQIHLSNIATPLQTTEHNGSYQFVGEAGRDILGVKVSSAGDVDRDGKADLLISALGHDADGVVDSDEGATYLVAAKDLKWLDQADGTVDGKISMSKVEEMHQRTLEVNVDDTGNGTSLKKGLLGGTDTLTSTENYIAAEVLGQTDEITMTTTVTDRSTVTGLDDNAAGTFTHGASSSATDGTTVSFGPAGSGAPQTLSQLLADNALAGTFKITSGDETGKVGNISFENFETINFTVEARNNMPCFTAGTLISTIEGDVNVELLRTGDLVETQDNDYQEIRWIGRRKLSRADLEAQPNLIPVRIAAGALGAGLPERDLIVSPQHRMLISSKIAERLFDSEEVLVAAKQLIMLDGIDYVDDPDGVEYVHFMCSRHEVVFAEGAPTETMYGGHQALLAVSEEARQEIFAIFPELAEMDPDYRPPSARYLPSGRMGRKLATRHRQNNKPILQTW